MFSVTTSLGSATNNVDIFMINAAGDIAKYRKFSIILIVSAFIFQCYIIIYRHLFPVICFHNLIMT